MSNREFKVVAIAGSVNRPSKSLALAQAIADAALGRLDFAFTSYDLLDAGPGLGAAFSRSELSAAAALVVEAIESADAVIAVSPVYKGSYTGLFKHLFDFVGPTSLVNKPVVVGATGGGNKYPFHDPGGTRSSSAVETGPGSSAWRTRVQFRDLCGDRHIRGQA